MMVPSSPFASGDAVRRVFPFVLFVLTVLAPTFSFAGMEGETVLSDKSLLKTLWIRRCDLQEDLS